jgi:hypothetical protein
VERSVGGTGIDEVIAFRVSRIAAVASVPVDEFTSGGPLRPVRGAKLIAVNVTYRNDTKDSIDPFCGGNGATLVDEQDRNFDPLPDQLDARAAGDMRNEVQPGFRGIRSSCSRSRRT